MCKITAVKAAVIFVSAIENQTTMGYNV